jgi:hypothetical protein
VLTTITNTTSTVGLPSRTINGLDTYVTLGVGVAQLTATGGARKDILPYPFAHIGALAAAATKQLPMHPRDWRHRDVFVGSPMDAGEEWQALVNAGTVSMTFASQTGRRDSEELFLAAV